MNKFDAVFSSIKKIISEQTQTKQDGVYFYFDFSLYLINQKYASNPIDINYIKDNADFNNVELIKVDPEKDDYRLIALTKQQLLAVLYTFIDADKIDEISTFILRNPPYQEQNLE